MKIAHLIDYVSHLLKKYSEIQQTQMTNTFRVASIKNLPNGSKIIFQVIGKSTFMECTPAEILANEAFLERFSKRDIQKITYAQAQDENLMALKRKEHAIKLARQEFSIKDGRTKFTLTDQKGNLTHKTAADITLDKKIINNLSQQDALNIGYVAGYEHSQIELID